MNQHAPIRYSGFWDRPLSLTARYRGTLFYFYREFDDLADEYQDAYSVYILSDIADEMIVASWGQMNRYIVRELGLIPVQSVLFDRTFRQSIDTDVLELLIKRTTIDPDPL